MIDRIANIRELNARILSDGSEAWSVSVSFDESAATTLRLSREEHDDLALALRSGLRFVVGLRVFSDSTTDTTSEGGTK